MGTINRPQVASATFVYQLPFGAGHGWNSENRALSQVISNWQLSGIFTFTTGAPLSITGTCNGYGVIDSSCYPNVTPGYDGSVWLHGSLSTAASATSTAFLNKAAFTNPVAGTYGDAARTAPYGLFAPSVSDVDVSVRREFVIRESLRFALQVDAFNVNNGVYFAAPNTTLSSANFGTFTSQANQARKLQFSGRLMF